MTIRHRRACGGLHHSEGGIQYASAAYRRLLADAQFTRGTSRVGDCWDNAVVESFFATLTKELLTSRTFESRGIAHRELFEFIEIWYNRKRRPSSLGYRSPAQFEEAPQKVS
jgi:transposase InsO family protein